MKQVQASSVVDTRQPGIAPQTNARTVEHAKRSANYLAAMEYGPKPHDFHVSSEIVSHAVLVKVQNAEMQAVMAVQLLLYTFYFPCSVDRACISIYIYMDYDKNLWMLLTDS